jgi:hypothetical protein
MAGVLTVRPPVASAPAPLLVAEQEPGTPVRPNRLRRTSRRVIADDPLVIDPISVPLIAVDSSSGVMPIRIEPLQIEPLQRQ